MLFNSYIFIFLFLPIVLTVFFLLGRFEKHRAALMWLVLASLFFYGWWNPTYILLIITSALFNYGIGRLLATSQGRKQKGILALGIAANLATLGYFKYTNFFIDTLDALTNLNVQIGQIVLPLAISFFTFQQIAYLVDVYRSKVCERNLVRYGLFVTFFPQLIAGPIVHHGEMLPQFSWPQRLRFNPQHLAVGTTIFVLGLFKKVVLADHIAVFANLLFDGVAAGQTPTIFDAWFGLLAYAMQIYFDFSGYSDMAIGLARMFGILLPLNFHSPYKSTNIIGFWQRWHMTLSRFLRDYLYIPLGGNRKGRARRYLNLMLTMLLGGLWHGASWTFVVWGGLHGAYLMINHVWQQLSRSDRFPLPSGKRWTHALSVMLTFLSVCIAWVFFRAVTFENAWTILQAMVGKGGLAIPAILENRLGFLEPWLVQLGVSFSGNLYRTWGASDLRLGVPLMLLLLFITWALPNTQQFMARYRPALDVYRFKDRFPRWIWLQWRPTFLWAVLMAFLAIWSLISMNKLSPFLYFQF